MGTKLEKLRKMLEKDEVNGLLITNDINRRYVTNFTGTAGVVLVTQKDAVFITDFRYMEQANEQVKDFDIVEHIGPIHEKVREMVEELNITKLAFEKNDLTYSEYEKYEKELSCSFIPKEGYIEKIRLLKTPEEITILKEAATIADEAFSYILTKIRPGVREIEIANELEFFMRSKGADSSSFDIIVASGYRSALPHGVASQKEIQSGELVTLDFGALYKGYCSDITRTVAVGKINDELKEIYQTVLDAQIKGVTDIKAGITAKEADALTRDHIKSKGYGDYFGHSTGHGLGLEVHEMPGLSYRSETILEAGMVVTVEPGIYVPGVGGCRIEDDIVITDNGCTILTESSKELIELPI